MNQTLLTLCIPTYNRSSYLDDCLKSIKIQVDENKNLNDAIEVVISDNGSSDNTSEIADKYKDYFKHFKYVKNEKNLGFDLNVLNVVKNATSTYCWYIGDDDVIVNGGIELVLSSLQENKYDVVTIVSSDRKDSEPSSKKITPENVFIEVENFNEFYFKGYCKGIFCDLIFNRETWLQLVDTKSYLEYSLYYETVLNVTSKTKKKMLHIDYPLISARQDCRWIENGYELTTFINFNLLLEKMITFGFDTKKVTDLLISNSKRIIIILLRAKGHNLTCNLENLQKIYKSLRTLSYLNLIFVTIIYFTPNWIIAFIRDTKKAIVKKLQ